MTSFQFSWEPEEAKSIEETDLFPFLDQAFDSLTPEAKQRVRDEIYGLEAPIEETEAFVNNKLRELEREINLLSEEVKQAYVLAVKMEEELEESRTRDKDGNNNTTAIPTKAKSSNSPSESYVKSVAFRCMFLRTDKFDAKFAARRITRYFQEKLNLFGQEKLPRRITQADLNERDMDALYTGGFFTNGYTDESGRLVVTKRRKYFHDHNIINLKRAYFYMVQLHVENNETVQKKGVVVIAQNRNFHSSSTEERYRFGPWETRRLYPLLRMSFFALPWSYAAAHILYDDMFSHIAIRLMLVVTPKKKLPAVLPHYTLDDEECKEDLRDYGIDFDSLPLTKKGDFDTEQIRDYYEEIRRQEVQRKI